MNDVRKIGFVNFGHGTIFKTTFSKPFTSWFSNLRISMTDVLEVGGWIHLSDSLLGGKHHPTTKRCSYRPLTEILLQVVALIVGHPKKLQVLILPSFWQNYEKTYVKDQILAISDNKLTFMLVFL